MSYILYLSYIESARLLNKPNQHSVYSYTYFLFSLSFPFNNRAVHSTVYVYTSMYKQRYICTYICCIVKLIMKASVILVAGGKGDILSGRKQARVLYLYQTNEESTCLYDEKTYCSYC